MNLATLLLVYCLLIACASLAGGWLPMFFRFSHTGMQVTISFVGGAMLGVGLLHLLPHAFFELQNIYSCAWWLLIGFVAMFFIERVFHFHHHDAPDEHNECSDPSHHHTHTSARGWQAALAGLTLHSATDGMALAASVAAEKESSAHWLTSGLAVFLVVLLHKPFDSLALGTLMAVHGESRRTRVLVNLAYALAVPIGVILFLFGIGGDSGAEYYIGAALAFSAGTFLCISTSDLLPELQFHAHDRVKLSVSLLAGLALTAALVLIESQGHAHDHDHSSSPSEPHHLHAIER